MQIADLRRQALQSSELEENVILRKLQEEYDELYKNKEEQDERLDAIKYKNEGLNET